MSGHLQDFESDLQLGDQSIKESACNAGDPGSIPGLRRSSAEGNGNPLQYSCLDNPMDGSRGAPGKSGLHASGEGERVIAPEPW